MVVRAELPQRHFVRDEERGTLREVVRICGNCARIGWAADYPSLTLYDPPIVSPTGTVHHGDNGYTTCGIDATGNEWWHAL